MRRSRGGKCVLTGTCTVGYGSSEQIPDACLPAQGLGAIGTTDLSQVLQTLLAFFFMTRSLFKAQLISLVTKADTLEKFSPFKLQFEAITLCNV